MHGLINVMPITSLLLAKLARHDNWVNSARPYAASIILSFTKLARRLQVWMFYISSKRTVFI